MVTPPVPVLAHRGFVVSMLLRPKGEQELRLNETRLRHLVEAVACGESSETLFAALRAEEELKKILLQQLADVQEREKVVSLDTKRLAHDLRARLGDIKALLSRHTLQARQILKTLLEEPLVCEPFQEGGQSGYRFSGIANYGRFLPTGTFTNHGGGGHPQPDLFVPSVRVPLRTTG